MRMKLSRERGDSPRAARGAAENLGERFGDPGGPDPGEATSSAASASSMRERAAQELNPEMGHLGAEDPSTAFSAAPLGPGYAPGGRSAPGHRVDHDGRQEHKAGHDVLPLHGGDPLQVQAVVDGGDD